MRGSVIVSAHLSLDATAAFPKRQSVIFTRGTQQLLPFRKTYTKHAQRVTEDLRISFMEAVPFVPDSCHLQYSKAFFDNHQARSIDSPWGQTWTLFTHSGSRSVKHGLIRCHSMKSKTYFICTYSSVKRNTPFKDLC